MTEVSFADVVHQSITFSTEDKAEALLLKLIDDPWFQRLRDVSQTANTRLVYMFSEHSRFGHCIGVAYLAKLAMDRLMLDYPKDIAEHRTAVLVAALLHDVGHLAPGSHTAFKTWFPGQKDSHERIAEKVILESSTIRKLLDDYSKDLVNQVVSILGERDDTPPWAWQLISGGGWNVDRGNWSTVDSILAGVSYGKYNIPALIDSIIITPDKQMGLRENRLDAMMHFVVSRHAMYRQMYQHRVLLGADTLNKAAVLRAKSLRDNLEFCDETMHAVLSAENAEELSLSVIFQMREAWWRYHILRWSKSSDPILSDLSRRIIDRRLFKTLRTNGEEQTERLIEKAKSEMVRLGLDPTYYLHVVSTADVHAGDWEQALLVQQYDGSLQTLGEAEPLFRQMAEDSRSSKKTWLVLPADCKTQLNIAR